MKLLIIAGLPQEFAVSEENREISSLLMEIGRSIFSYFTNEGHDVSLFEQNDFENVESLGLLLKEQVLWGDYDKILFLAENCQSDQPSLLITLRSDYGYQGKLVGIMIERSKPIDEFLVDLEKNRELFSLDYILGYCPAWNEDIVFLLKPGRFIEFAKQAIPQAMLYPPF